MPLYSAEIQHLLYEDDAGRVVGLAGVQRLAPVPPARLNPARALLGSPDEYLAYQAALVLTAWGDTQGLRHLEQLIDGRVDQRLALAPHPMGGYDNGYDEMARAVGLYGLAPGTERPAQLRVLGKLLALYGPCFFESGLKAALLALEPPLAAELGPAVSRALSRTQLAGQLYLASQLLPPLVRVDGTMARTLLNRFLELLRQAAPEPSAEDAERIRANGLEVLDYLPVPVLDFPAARAALVRINNIEWNQSDDHERLGSQIALMQEYLHRAALVALELGEVGWPWFDAATRLTLPVHGLNLVPAAVDSTLPGYAHLDYEQPRTDPLEEEVITLYKELDSRRLANRHIDSTCRFYVHWEALKNYPAVRALALPDLYEPLILFYERGGQFRMEQSYIDMLGVTISRGSPDQRAQSPSLSSLDPAVLDQIDQEHISWELHKMLTGTLAQVVPWLQAYEAVLQPRASEVTLAALQTRARAALGLPVPAGYLTFLRLVDGLNWDDLLIYGSGPYPLVTEPTVCVRDFVATNLAWRLAEPAAASRLYLAEDQGLLYAYEPAAGALPYLAYERAGGAVTERFKSAEELLGHALQRRVWEDKKAWRGAR
ncbi:hypothetical protein A0257_20130 [Hymenobacter psoromatis]|nr:hypothetical protein A0257_20130 [Hymenobacter psoromatis]